ncbi:MAG TPA: caspase family protein [Candidatus Limnocylindrales bacterium]|nr:caspase family protein [Candidatus Limnocylindrales bacterium]
MTGKRAAMLIGIGHFVDDRLTDLHSSINGVSELAAVLADPQIGDYEVTTMIDIGTHEVMAGVERFFGERGVDDLVLFYVSTHGLLDPRGRLYFATSDTRTDLLASTALSSQFLVELMDDCRARRQVVLIDSSFSGAFARGTR